MDNASRDIDRAIIDQREYARANRAAIDAEWDALPDGRVPPLTDEEKRRAALEWEQWTKEMRK